MKQPDPPSLHVNFKNICNTTKQRTLHKDNIGTNRQKLFFTFSFYYFLFYFFW